MTAELLAIQFLIGWSVLAFFLSLFIFRFMYKKESEKLLEMLNIETIKNEFQEIVHENMQGAIDAIGETFSEILTDPTVKKGFSLIASQGGKANAQNIAVDNMAKDILDGPQFAAIRMGAEALGLDIESYIEKYGAVKTIQAAKQLGAIAGIDIMNLDLGSLSLPRAGGSGTNPYIRR